MPDTTDDAAPPAHGTAGSEETAEVQDSVRRGSLISIGAYVGAQVLRLAGNLILTRLLAKEVFGLMALVQVFLTGLHLFSDIGVGPNIVQSESGKDPKFLHTAFSLQLIRGLALFAGCCIGAVPMAEFYGEDVLKYILPVSGLSAFVISTQSTKYWTEHRDMRFGRIAAVDLGSQAIMLTTTIVLAYIHRSVWAIVVGSLVGDVFKSIVTHTAMPGIRDRLGWDKESLGALIRFGRWIFVSTALVFFVTQADRLIFGKMIPIGLLGVYSIAVALATIPSAALGHLTGKVLLPAFSRIKREGGDLAAEVRRIRWPILLLSAWICSGFIGGGQAAIDLLYEDRYREAGWMLQVLSVGAWFMVLEATVGPVLLSLGESKWMAAANASKLVGMAILIPLGFWWKEFPGAVLGYAASEMLRYAMTMIPARLYGYKFFDHDVALCGLVAIASGLGWLATAGAAQISSYAIVACLAVLLAVSLFFAPFGAGYLKALRARRGSGSTSVTG